MSERMARKLSRKVKMRSYRKPRQMLFVFGTALLALGIGLVGVFTLHRNRQLVWIGTAYLLVALLLLGLRGILAYLDEENKRRRAAMAGRMARNV